MPARRAFTSQEIVNSWFQSDVRDFFPVNEVALSFQARKTQEPADVVILVERRKQLGGFFDGKSKRGKRDVLAKRLGERGIPFQYLY